MISLFFCCRSDAISERMYERLPGLCTRACSAAPPNLVRDSRTVRDLSLTSPTRKWTDGVCEDGLMASEVTNVQGWENSFAATHDIRAGTRAANRRNASRDPGHLWPLGERMLANVHNTKACNEGEPEFPSNNDLSASIAPGTEDTM